ncbi:MAG: hypothetical protein IK115_07385 [Lachnospiraceae bacterium]|nr:hypothetical protein [Lachnospiraceae bacterium]
MYFRMIRNDQKKNKLVSAAACIFMAVSAAFIALTVLLAGSLLGSIDALMKEAKTCDFLQMHAGELDAEALRAFAASRPDVEDMLIGSFLNIENSTITLNGRSLADSTQDNGLCIQNENFDHLLGTDNELLHPGPGRVYVPVCYKSEYDLEAGQTMEIGSTALVIEGFLRDSQMNSMMASSKRFLVNPEDYDRLEGQGSPEYLIEFLIKDGYDIDAFATAYTDAGLPSNGPTITAPLIRLMNALSDGMMILVIFLAGIVILAISLICIRYIVLTGMEKDRKEAGMLKALGLGGKDVRKICLLKYELLSFAGGMIGAIAALIISKPLSMQMRELYGAAGGNAWTLVFSLAGIVLTEAIVLMSIKRNLKKNDNLSAVQVISERENHHGKKKDSFIWIGAVTAAAIFLILVPVNLSSTISSEKFVSYMGVGQSRIRMDIRQCEDIAGISKGLTEKIKNDKRVDKYSLMQTGSFRAVLKDGSNVNLLTEMGDHEAFPLQYIEGASPKKAGEIALSKLNSEELGCAVGDGILLQRKGKEEAYTVCGIYSDITNGGKTAKIFGDAETLTAEDIPLMWSIIYVSLKEEGDTEAFTEEYRTYCSEYGNSVKISDIARYMEGTYGQTIKRIRNAAILSFAVSCLIIFIVIVLFVRLMIWQEKSDISLKKALGISSSHIRREYLKRSFIYIVGGLALGILLGVFLGQQIAGMMLASLGAAGFRFILDWRLAFVLVPFTAFAVALLAVRTGSREVASLNIRCGV